MPQILLSLPLGWVADSLKTLLSKVSRDASVTLTADFQAMLAAMAARTDLDLLVWAPVEHPDVRGALRQIAAIRPSLPVVLLLPRRNVPQEAGCLQAGASAVVWPGMTEPALIEAIRLVLGGGRPSLPVLHSLQDVHQAQNGFRSAPAIIPQAPPPELRRFRLTARQIEVLQLIGEGLTNKSIARRLGLQEGTVKVHLRQILRQLGVQNRTQAALLVRDQPTAVQRLRATVEPVSPTEASPPFDGRSDD